MLDESLEEGGGLILMLKVLFPSLLAIVINDAECVLVSLDQYIEQALQVHMKLFENGFSTVGGSK